MSADVIVIGAGVGGLSAAALLAQLGRRVVVLEQHTTPGGFSMSFHRGPWSWDVGLHVVGEMGPRGLAGRAFDALSGGRLSWQRIEGAWDEAELPGGERVRYLAPPQAFRDHLVERFPREAAGIDRWFELSRAAATAMREHFVARGLTLRPPRSDRELALRRTADVLASVTEDPALRAALGIHWFFYGTPPKRSAFGIHALLMHHYRQGAYYPHGGAQSIARALAAELVAQGGELVTGASVERLAVRHGQVRGVVLSTGETLTADTVISAAGAHNTLALLPEGEREQEWAAALEALAPSSPHVCLHLGLQGDVRAAGASETNLWLVHGAYDEVWDTASARPPVAYLAFPSLKDGAERGGRHTAEVVAFTTFAPFAPFAGTRWRARGEAYEALKRRLTERLLGLVLERFPKLEPLVRHVELSTPLSSAHFARAVRGSAYGLDSTPERFACRALKPRTPVRGLHLAGCDVAMIGIAGAMVGGLAAAVSTEPERAGAWMRRQLRTKGGTR